jgi:hypothetical protein
MEEHPETKEVNADTMTPCDIAPCFMPSERAGHRERSSTPGAGSVGVLCKGATMTRS